MRNLNGDPRVFITVEYSNADTADLESAEKKESIGTRRDMCTTNVINTDDPRFANPNTSEKRNL